MNGNENGNGKQKEMESEKIDGGNGKDGIETNGVTNSTVHAKISNTAKIPNTANSKINATSFPTAPQKHNHLPPTLFKAPPNILAWLLPNFLIWAESHDLSELPKATSIGSGIVCYEIDEEVLRACYGVRVEEFCVVGKVGGKEEKEKGGDDQSVSSSPVKNQSANGQSTNSSPVKAGGPVESTTTSPKKKNKKGKGKAKNQAITASAELVSTTFFLPLLETLPTLHASKRRICRFAQVPAEYVTIADENVVVVYHEMLTHRPTVGCVGDGSESEDGALGGDGAEGVRGGALGGDGGGALGGDSGGGSVFGAGTGGAEKNLGKGKFFKVSYVGETLIDTREASQANGGATNIGVASTTTAPATGATSTDVTAPPTNVASTTTTLAEVSTPEDPEQAEEESEEMKKYNRIQRIMDMDFGFGWSNPRGVE